MKFDDWWKKYEVEKALKFLIKGDVKVGWDAALEYGSEKPSPNTDLVKLLCPKCQTPCNTINNKSFKYVCIKCGHQWKK